MQRVGWKEDTNFGVTPTPSAPLPSSPIRSDSGVKAERSSTRKGLVLGLLGGSGGCSK